MKKIRFIFLLAFFSPELFAQNLVQNPSFDQNNLEINCASWYNGCGEALSLHCDTTTYCMVGFSQQSPSVIPENRWSVKIDGGFPNGTVMQHFTGLNGNLVFKLEAWHKAFIPSSSGMISIGKTVDGQYLESKNTWENAEDWTLISLTDTVYLNPNDSLTILLAGEMGDFVFKQTLYDDVSLEILETLNTTEIKKELFKWSFDVKHSVVGIQNKSNEKLNLCIYNLLGQKIYTYSIEKTLETKVDLSFLDQATYLLELKAKDETVSQLKIVKL